MGFVPQPITFYLLLVDHSSNYLYKEQFFVQFTHNEINRLSVFNMISEPMLLRKNSRHYSMSYSPTTSWKSPLLFFSFKIQTDLYIDLSNQPLKSTNQRMTKPIALKTSIKGRSMRPHAPEEGSMGEFIYPHTSNCLYVRPRIRHTRLTCITPSSDHFNVLHHVMSS